MNEEVIDFREVWRIVRDRAWIVVLVTGACLMIAFAYLQMATPIYRATATIQIEQSAQNLAQVDDIIQQDLKTVELLKTIENRLTMPSLLWKVLRDHPVPGWDAGSGPESLGVRLLQQSVSVELRRGTRLLDIHIDHPDRTVAKRLANALPAAFLEDDLTLRAEAARGAARYLAEEAENLRRKLEGSELAAQQFRQEHRAVSLEEQQNIVVDSLKDLSTRLTEARAERIRLEADWSEAQQGASNAVSLLSIPSVASHERIAETRKQLDTARAEIANLSKRYLEKHPKMIQARSALDTWEHALESELSQSPERLQASYQIARRNELALEQALKNQETLALELDKQAVSYRQLNREAEANRLLYESLLRRVKETEATSELQRGIAQIVQPAILPERPAKPRKRTAILGGLAAGLALGVGLALGLYYLDSSLKSVDEAEAYLGLPVLGVVGALKSVQQLQDAVVTLSDPGGRAAEGFRSLRATLELLGRGSDRKVILLTSADPGEGKTFSSSNLAIVLAQQRLRTLLIDADLRRPSISRAFPTALPTLDCPGVVECLAGQIPAALSLVPSGLDYLTLLPAGRLAPNPSELLASDAFSAMIRDLRGDFDRIVIDTAPVNAVSDTLLIADCAEVICLVCAGGKTPRHHVSRAKDLLERSNLRISGLILNRVIQRESRAAYAYHYGYGERAAPLDHASNGSGTSPPADDRAARPRTPQPEPTLHDLDR